MAAPGCTLVFPVRYSPLRWQRGINSGTYALYGMTQISGRAPPPGPAHSRPVVAGHRRSRGGGGDPPGQSPAPARGQLATPAQRHKAWTLPAPDGQQSATLQIHGALTAPAPGARLPHPGTFCGHIPPPGCDKPDSTPPRHQPLSAVCFSLLPSFRSRDPLTSVREEGRSPHRVFALPRCELRAGRGRGRCHNSNPHSGQKKPWK